MVWVILVAVGIPLWLCAAGILTLLHRNRSLRMRDGDIPLRLRRAPDKRWVRGHALRVQDVVAFRSSPAGWSESLLWVVGGSVREPTPDEHHKLRRLGAPVIARLDLHGGDAVEVAADANHLRSLVRPEDPGHRTNGARRPAVAPWAT
jgi:hypothetical protein